MDIDDKWIDVDFSKQPFARGSLPRDPAGRMYGSAEAAMEQIPESQWQAEAERLDESGGGLDRMVVEVKDQSNEGSCVGNATAQLHQVIQAAQFGRNRVVKLSAVSLYKQIGSSPSSGAMIDDALEAGTDTGILPLDNEENRKRFPVTMSATGFRQPWPTDWKSTAKLFRFDERTIINTIGGMMTCLFRGFPCVVGRAGHSILYLRPVWKNGQWFIKYVNSWSLDWGEGFGEFSGGFGHDSLRLITESADWSFTVRSILVPDMFDLTM